MLPRKLSGIFNDFFKKVNKAVPAQVKKLVKEREAFRKARDFAKADQIRNDLKAQGIELEDGKNGTTWRRV